MHTSKKAKHNVTLKNSTHNKEESAGPTTEAPPASSLEQLHPMLPQITPDILELIALNRSRVQFESCEKETVSKSYEDEMLRPPNLQAGERYCASKGECKCLELALRRYGDHNTYGFVGVEFLTPTQKTSWLHGDKLPDLPGKCLLCLRYLTTETFISCRANCRETVLPKDKVVLNGGLPPYANKVGGHDGYRRQALINVDSEWMVSKSLRDKFGADIFSTPFVRFSSSHYNYCKRGNSCFIQQINVGESDTVHARGHLNGQPSDEKVACPAASTATKAPSTKRLIE